MFSANFAATTGAATDPHPVLGYLGPRQGGQLGDVGQVYSFLSQLPPTAGAGLQGHWYVHWRFGDFLRAWRLAEREWAFSRFAAGALGLTHPGAFGKGRGLALALSGQLVHLSTQFLVAGSQLGHLLLQHRNLALQLSHQGQQFLSIQWCYVFRGTHSVKCSQLAPGPQPHQPERYSITIDELCVMPLFDFSAQVSLKLANKSSYGALSEPPDTSYVIRYLYSSFRNKYRLNIIKLFTNLRVIDIHLKVWWNHLRSCRFSTERCLWAFKISGVGLLLL
jgi:hypothetical protein